MSPGRGLNPETAPLGVATDLIERGFAAALRSGYPSPDDWAESVATYGRDYMAAGAAEIQKRLAADLVVLQQQLDTPFQWATAAKLATLYAKTFPGSDGAKAANWYLHAASFADRSGDLGTRVWMRGRATRIGLRRCVTWSRRDARRAGECYR